MRMSRSPIVRRLFWALLFWICLFFLWAGDFAVIPSHKYDPANLAYDAFWIVLAVVFGLLFLRAAFRD